MLESLFVLIEREEGGVLMGDLYTVTVFSTLVDRNDVLIVTDAAASSSPPSVDLPLLVFLLYILILPFCCLLILSL